MQDASGTFPDPRREKPWLAEAMRMAALPAWVPPDYDPPVSTFPLTRAAKEALRITNEKRRKRS